MASRRCCCCPDRAQGEVNRLIEPFRADGGRLARARQPAAAPAADRSERAGDGRGGDGGLARTARRSSSTPTASGRPSARPTPRSRVRHRHPRTGAGGRAAGLLLQARPAGQGAELPGHVMVGSLPNLIADRADRAGISTTSTCGPEHLARWLEALLADTPPALAARRLCRGQAAHGDATGRPGRSPRTSCLTVGSRQ